MKNLGICNNLTERIIMAIDSKNNYSSKILRNLGATYAHGAKVFRVLADHKIITKINVGRKIHIKLTKKGVKIQEYLKEIKKLL